MENSKFTVGDKVKIPKTKRGVPNYHSVVVSRVKEMLQDYLYVTEVDGLELVLNEDQRSTGDYFLISEVELYEQHGYQCKSTCECNQDVALRYNDGKLKWSLVHYGSLIPMVEVLMFGAQKYSANNWMKPMDSKEILDSLQRHLASLMDGEPHDKESKLHHIGHILCNAMFYSYHNVINKDAE